MARGKIQIKRIENVTNRQVTYSKRRNGLFKKANELTVLCDAKVSLLMVSSSGKLHEFISPSTTTKQVYDEYQKLLGIDLWKSHYETMQENLKKLKEINKSLRRQISHRVGECLNDLRFAELHSLEKEMESAVEVVRNRKLKLISNQIDTKRKKIRNATECNRRLYEYDAMEEPHYGLVDDGGDYYDSAVIGYSANEDPHNVFPLRLQPSHHPNLHRGGGSSDLTTYSLL
ncbi:floral homeotic protein DEFICIENS isoform X1 [Rosa rugosa]|uniref:MADS-box protein n=1 Tax=Rosa rugosa TaxID=74645 RepID=Q7X9I8_ROSRU|nr:floral homeotic protein DEFICIENS isoform X1 [Rosa rugosa]XP_062024793.1 floral homeotic protein DEFICIENS isoform X1 [Rosa rugosa]BAC79180.1 MADS-box protein [Rosa rugosa]